MVFLVFEHTSAMVCTNQWKQQEHTEQPEAKAEKLQHQLLKAQKDLVNAGRTRRLSEELRGKLCTSEAFNEKNEALGLEVEVKKNKASILAQLEQQQKENIKMVAALRRAEEEKASLQQTLQKKKEEWTQREITMETRLDELESMIPKQKEDKKSKKKMNWLVRLFTWLATAGGRTAELVS